MRIWRAPAVVAASLVAAVVPFEPAMADVAAITLVDDAWFAASPTCVLPTGCADSSALPPNSTYPAGTLHVGVAAGREEARSYLRLRAASLPPRAVVTGGTLVVPFAGEDAGTRRAEDAAILACLVTTAFSHAEGSYAPPPEVDCTTTVPAALDAANRRFTVDLAHFASRWVAGADVGIALLPVPGNSPAGTWHVAFHGTRAGGDDARPPEAQLVYEPAGEQVPSRPPPSGGQPAGGTRDPGVFDPVAPSPGPVAPAPLPPVGSTEAGGGGPAQAPASSVAGGGPGFAYPAVMALPLVLLAAAAYLAWALTRPLSPTGLPVRVGYSTATGLTAHPRKETGR